MTDYTVIKDDGLDRLISGVRDFIKDGWKPIGGIAVLFSTWKDEIGWERSEITYYQAMEK